MSDLIERLRSKAGLMRAWHGFELGGQVPAKLDLMEFAQELAEAADEIERLREQLVIARKELGFGSFVASEWVKTARGPRDRKVALIFEKFCNDLKAKLSNDQGTSK